MNDAKLTFVYASMNAGKSTQLLQLAKNYSDIKKETLLYTASVDNRAGTGIIASRLGAQQEAITFNEQTNFFAHIGTHKNISCVLIDEAQFATQKQVEQLRLVVSIQNIPVICYGLRSDFLGHPFTGSSYLLALADELREIGALCACTSQAKMNLRIDAEGNRVDHGNQILIGGNDQYRQVCAKCFFKGKRQLAKMHSFIPESGNVEESYWFNWAVETNQWMVAALALVSFRTDAVVFIDQSFKYTLKPTGELHRLDTGIRQAADKFGVPDNKLAKFYERVFQMLAKHLAQQKRQTAELSCLTSGPECHAGL